MRLIVIFCMMAAGAMADTNKVVKAEKERKTEHADNKMIVKERGNGSSEWKTVKEFTLMFKNNRKARKPKGN
jgi:hypothetical protein